MKYSPVLSKCEVLGDSVFLIKRARDRKSHFGRTGVYISKVFAMYCLCASTSIHAEVLTNQWRPIVGIGGGVTNTINLGQSITFPIVDVNRDEYYIYTPKNQAQTQGVIDVFLGIEKRLVRHQRDWIVQAELAYTQSSAFKEQGYFEQGADLQSANQYQYQFSTAMRRVILEGKLMMPYEKWLPYLSLGLGGAINSAYDYQTTVPIAETYTRNYADSTLGSLSYRVGVGVELEFMKQMRLGVLYRFADLGSVSLGRAKINQTGVSGTLSQTDVYANEILFQLTYHM